MRRSCVGAVERAVFLVDARVERTGRGRAADDGIGDLDGGAAEEFDAVRDGAEHAIENLSDGARVTGEIEDERLSSGDAELAGEGAGENVAEGDGAHQLAEAGEDAVRDGECGIGSDIARGGTGAAGGEDEAAAFVVDEGAERGLNQLLFVGNEPGDRLPGGGESCIEPLMDSGAATVFVLAAAGAV